MKAKLTLDAAQREADSEIQEETLKTERTEEQGSETSSFEVEELLLVCSSPTQPQPSPITEGTSPRGSLPQLPFRAVFSLPEIGLQTTPQM